MKNYQFHLIRVEICQSLHENLLIALHCSCDSYCEDIKLCTNVNILHAKQSASVWIHCFQLGNSCIHWHPLQ